MKEQLKNCLATTALALLVLSIVANLFHGRFLCIETVYQVFASSIVIHLALKLLEHFESKYYLVESLVEIGTVIAILLAFGFVCNWYDSIPGWVLVLIGLIVYLAGSFMDIFHINQDIKCINEELKSRKEHMES